MNENSYEYGQTVLKPLFEMVQNKENWKFPIDAHVPEGTDLELLRKAVINFTGSVPSFEKTAYKQDGKIIRGYRVRAAGYYVTIGA